VNIDVADSYEQMSRRAEGLVVAELKRHPQLILCASAGGTPTRLYELLAARHRRQPRLFRKMRVLQIDEWGGLPPGHAASCETDLRRKLLEPLGIGNERYAGFKTAAADLEAECSKMRHWLAKNGPIDICILGLGHNGHVAMNEPAPGLTPHTHISALSPSSLNHPMLKDLKQKPRYGLTLGMADILSSRMVLLMVNGAHKREALKRLLQPTVTTHFPASFVWLHARGFLLCDRKAAQNQSPRKSAKGTKKT
jgi:galactosamine-6-phosphate isomerase